MRVRNKKIRQISKSTNDLSLRVSKAGGGDGSGGSRERTAEGREMGFKVDTQEEGEGRLNKAGRTACWNASVIKPPSLLWSLKTTHRVGVRSSTLGLVALQLSEGLNMQCKTFA